MGLTSLPEVGAGEALGPVKQDKPLKYPDELREILAAEHNAAMAALEGVCAEVGLTDGSTVGSLVERVTTLESAPPGSGDVVGPASATNGRVAVFDGGTGKLIADGGTLLSALATNSNLTSHTSNTSNPHSVTAAQVGAAPTYLTQRTKTTSTSIMTEHANERLLVAVNGSDLYVQLEDATTAGQRSIVTRGDLGGGGDVIIIGVDGDHVITGPTILTRALDTVEVRLDSISGATYYWVTSRKDVYEDMEIRATHTSATRTMAARDRGTRTPLDPTSNTIAVTLPHTLPVGFACEFVALNVANAITFAGSGGLGLTYYGDSTITAGDIIRISVESATVCRVDITHTGALSGPSSGTDGALLIWDGAGGRLVADSGLLALDVVTGISDADTKATDALYPLVQTAHTSATKTLAAGDAGDIIPLNAASNAIEVTIPHTLFAAGGTGRAWSCGFYVTSVAGGAVTFVGSGGIVIKYFGKKPSATAIVAGDTIFITVVSATLAHVWISAEIP